MAIYNELLDVLEGALIDVVHHHVKVHQGVRYSTPQPVGLLNHPPPVPVCIACLSTGQPLLRLRNGPSSHPAPLSDPPSIPSAETFLGTIKS
jgi:hypothetical protein